MLPPRYDHQANEDRAPRRSPATCRRAAIVGGRLGSVVGGRRAGSGRVHVRLRVPLAGPGWLLCTTTPKAPRGRDSKIKPIERLVPVSFTRYRASTPGLSTSWSVTALKGELVSRGASRLDAFSGYPVRT